MTSLVTTGGTITLPDDMLWVDEMNWSPVGQQIEVTLGGAVIIETRTQAYGRPITLIGVDDGPWADTATMDLLRTAEAAQGDTPMTLTLPDGRTFSVLFLSGAVPGVYNGSVSSGPAVSANQVLLRAPSDSTERGQTQWIPTLRFIQIA